MEASAPTCLPKTGRFIYNWELWLVKNLPHYLRPANKSDLMVTNQPSAGTRMNLQASCPGLPRITDNTVYELLSISFTRMKYYIVLDIKIYIDLWVLWLRKWEHIKLSPNSLLSIIITELGIIHHHGVTTVQTWFYGIITAAFCYASAPLAM